MSVVDEIKSRLDILDVVSQYTNLQRSGRSYKAICPFHTEKTASFFVFPERQSWRCFGACASGGDMFSFLMRLENLDFGDALRRLAPQAGVKLDDKRGRKGQGNVLYEVNEAARDFFCRLLASDEGGSKARTYVENRGLKKESVEKFQLGLSPADGESTKRYLESKGWALDQIALAGLVTQGKDGGYRDLFRRRLIFPIRDADGELAGFGGRALDDSQPKYLNTPRSPIFDKSRILFGLYLARHAMEAGQIVIVEGYMDTLAAHQHGFSNVVAQMGTALTQQQVSLVRGLLRRAGTRDPGNVILALDPDTAGQEATLRSLESAWNVFQSKPFGRTQGATLYERPEMPTLKVAPLPQGRDPADVILANPNEWVSLVNGALPLMDYLFTALSSRLDLSIPQGKARLSELIFPLIAATPDPFQQDYYFQRLASLLGVSEATLQATLGRRSKAWAGNRDRSTSSRQGRATPAGQEDATTTFARLEHDPLEEYCLTLMLQNPQLLEPNSGPSADPKDGGKASSAEPRLEYFRWVENREVFTNWIKCSTLDILREELDEELQGHLDYLLTKSLPPSDQNQRETAFKDCVRRLEERYLRELKKEEEIKLSQSTAEETAERGEDILQLNERLKKVFKE